MASSECQYSLGSRDRCLERGVRRHARTRLGCHMEDVRAFEVGEVECLDVAGVQCHRRVPGDVWRSLGETIWISGEHDCFGAQVQIVVLAIRETERTVIAWAEAGVVGYIPNTAALADIATLLRDIIAGKQTCSEPVAAGMLRRIGRTSLSVNPLNDVPPVPILTLREMQIVELIASGHSNKEIAYAMAITEAGVMKHIEALMRRYRVARRTGLVHSAIQRGDFVLEGSAHDVANVSDQARAK